MAVFVIWWLIAAMVTLLSRSLIWLAYGGHAVHSTAMADSLTGPCTKQVKPIPATRGVDFPAEDPYLWYDYAAQWHLAAVKDNNGHFTKSGKSVALRESQDGLAGRLSVNPLVSTTEITWVAANKQKLNSLERPQLLFREDGTPEALLAAVDEGPARRHSYNPITFKSHSGVTN